MNVFQTLVIDEEGIVEMDTITYQGMFWLVPEWIDTPTPGFSRPARIIQLTGLAYSSLGDDFPQRFVVQNPIPTAVFDGKVPQKLASLYCVIEEPDIEVETHASGTVQ